MVWKELMDNVTLDLHALAPQATLTQRGVFSALTEAQHQLQMETAAVRKRRDFDLTTIDNAGYLDIGGLIHVIDRAEYIPIGRDTPTEEIFVVDEESLLSFIRRGCPPRGKSYVAAHEQDDDQVRIFPYKNNPTGTLRLHYQPKLKKYSPSETEQYPGYDGSGFADRIAQDGPETKFQVVTQGIEARAKLLLISRVPGAKGEFDDEKADWLYEWQQAIVRLSESNVQYGMNTNPDPEWAPVK